MPTSPLLPQACPSKEDLLAFAKGSLSPGRAEEVERHIETCHFCFAAADTRPLEQPLKDQEAVDVDRRNVGLPPGEVERGALAVAVTLPFPGGSLQASGGVAARADRNLLAGRYRLGKFIAKGGMGAVHRATDQLFRREVAVKLLLGSQEGEERAPPPSGAGNVTVESRPSASYV